VGFIFKVSGVSKIVLLFVPFKKNEFGLFLGVVVGSASILARRGCRRQGGHIHAHDTRGPGCHVGDSSARRSTLRCFRGYVSSCRQPYA
jgi:hypothetical protein